MSNNFKGLPLTIRMANNEPDRIFTIEEFRELPDTSKEGTTEYIDYSKVTKLTILLNDKFHYSNNVIISFFDVTAEIIVESKNASGQSERSKIIIKRGNYTSISILNPETETDKLKEFIIKHTLPPSRFTTKKILFRNLIKLSDQIPEGSFKIINWLEKLDRSNGSIFDYPSESEVSVFMICDDVFYYVLENGQTFVFDVLAEITVEINDKYYWVNVARGAVKYVKPVTFVIEDDSLAEPEKIVKFNGLPITINYKQHDVVRFIVRQADIKVEDNETLPKSFNHTGFYIRPSGIVSYEDLTTSRYPIDFKISFSLTVEKQLGKVTEVLEIKVVNGLVKEINELPNEFDLPDEIEYSELNTNECEKIITADPKISIDEIKLMESFVNDRPRGSTITIYSTDKGTRVACILISANNDTEILGGLEIVKQKLINSLL